MAQMVETNSWKQEKDLLLAPHLAFTVGVQVGNTGVSTVDGKKIIPAGTPIGGDTNALETRSTTLKVCTGATDGVKAQGILRADLDVTSGNANGEMIVFGFVDTSKCPITLDTTAKTTLSGKITFVNGGAY